MCHGIIGPIRTVRCHQSLHVWPVISDVAQESVASVPEGRAGSQSWQRKLLLTSLFVSTHRWMPGPWPAGSWSRGSTGGCRRWRWPRGSRPGWRHSYKARRYLYQRSSNNSMHIVSSTYCGTNSWTIKLWLCSIVYIVYIFLLVHTSMSRGQQ